MSMPSRRSEATSLERSQPAAGVRAFETGARSRERVDRPDSLLRGVLMGREEMLAGMNEGWEKFMSRNIAARVANQGDRAVFRQNQDCLSFGHKPTERPAGPFPAQEAPSLWVSPSRVQVNTYAAFWQSSSRSARPIFRPQEALGPRNVSGIGWRRGGIWRRNGEWDIWAHHRSLSEATPNTVRRLNEACTKLVRPLYDHNPTEWVRTSGTVGTKGPIRRS